MAEDLLPEKREDINMTSAYNVNLIPAKLATHEYICVCKQNFYIIYVGLQLTIDNWPP